MINNSWKIINHLMKGTRFIYLLILLCFVLYSIAFNSDLSKQISLNNLYVASEVTVHIGKMLYLKGLLLNVFLKLVPILVPLVIGTSSLMLNRYTEDYFNLILKNKNLYWLLYKLN